MSEIPLTQLTLLERLTEGHDQEAWRQFVEIYAPIVFQFVRRRGLQDSDAADLVQEVLLRVASAFRRGAYDRTRGRFRGWLLTVTRNELSDWLEARSRREQGGGGTTVQQILAELKAHDEDDFWRQEYEQHVFTWAARRVRSEVSSTTWASFWQTAIDQRSGQEVASALGISSAAVYLAKSRVMKRLRELVREIEDGPVVEEQQEEERQT